MAEMPPEVMQRSQWGFYSWWAGRPDSPFPDEFVVMAAVMGAELPDYFRGAEFITSGQIITAKGAAAIYEGEAFLWSTRVPMVALDGRLVAFMASRWASDIQSRFADIQDLAHEAPEGVADAIAHGHNLLLDRHFENVAALEALVLEAQGVGVPLWAEVFPSTPQAGGAGLPMFVMVPATVIEDWAAMLIELGAFIEDAQASIASGTAVGIVAAVEEERVIEDRRRVRGPVMVAIAAIGLAAFGMFMAVRSGKVSRGTQVHEDYAR